MSLAVTSAATVLLLLIVIVELLRRRQLREKYAILWLSVIVVILPVALFPRLLDGVAGRLGVASGASLILFLGFIFLLMVCIHLSWEVSRLEEETRTLAEETALLRTEIRAQLPNLVLPSFTESGGNSTGGNGAAPIPTTPTGAPPAERGSGT